MTFMSTHQRLEQVREVTISALECSVYVAPTDFGLTKDELLAVAAQVGFQRGEVLDSIAGATDLREFGGERYLPKHRGIWSQFHFYKEPEFRNFKAFEFICSELQRLVRAEGIRGANLDRNNAIERAVQSGIPRIDVQAAIAILAHDQHIIDKDGIIRFAPGREQYPLPSEQRAQSPKPTLRGVAIDADKRSKIYVAVKLVIARRNQGARSREDATMYNLLVSAQPGIWDGTEFVLARDRFLEHSDQDSLHQLKQLGQDAVNKTLEALPTLFAYEAPVNVSARVGWITSIRNRDRDVRITFRLDNEVQPIPAAQLAALKWELSIGEYELNRTHWAVKSVKLLETLQGGLDVHTRPRPYSLTPVKQPPDFKGGGSTEQRKKVFVVHGRDSASKNDVARFLEKLKLTPVILHERPNAGRTLITKFQEESADIEFAVVLMTPDDKGGLVDGAQSLRARQNVIFELGFFIGRLGSERVCALVQGQIEKPSDFDAVVYIPYGAETTWKTELMRELQYAGLPIDANLVL